MAMSNKNNKNNKKNQELEKHVDQAMAPSENFVVPQVGSITADLEKIKVHVVEKFADHKETGVQQAVKDLEPLFNRVIDLVNFIDQSTKEN